MEFDYRDLIGRIIAKFGSRRAFAKAVGRAENTISKKLSGKVPITKEDIENWSSKEVLDIAVTEIPAYFFTIKVQES